MKSSHSILLPTISRSPIVLCSFEIAGLQRTLNQSYWRIASVRKHKRFTFVWNRFWRSLLCVLLTLNCIDIQGIRSIGLTPSIVLFNRKILKLGSLFFLGPIKLVQKINFSVTELGETNLWYRLCYILPQKLKNRLFWQGLQIKRLRYVLGVKKRWLPHFIPNSYFALVLPSAESNTLKRSYNSNLTAEMLLYYRQDKSQCIQLFYRPLHFLLEVCGFQVISKSCYKGELDSSIPYFLTVFCRFKGQLQNLSDFEFQFLVYRLVALQAFVKVSFICQQFIDFADGWLRESFIGYAVQKVECNSPELGRRVIPSDGPSLLIIESLIGFHSNINLIKWAHSSLKWFNTKTREESTSQAKIQKNRASIRLSWLMKLIVRKVPLQLVVNTTFTWNLGGKAVYLTGSFTKWKFHYPMNKQGGDFSVTVALAKGIYQYKFIVDGQWRFNPDQPTQSDQQGNINNVINTTDYKQIDRFQEQISYQKPKSNKFAEFAPTAPVWTLNATYLNAKQHSKLQQSSSMQEQLKLNDIQKQLQSQTCLQQPSHIVVNHTAYRQTDFLNVRTLAITQKYKKKFTTFIMHLPLHQ